MGIEAFPKRDLGNHFVGIWIAVFRGIEKRFCWELKAGFVGNWGFVCFIPGSEIFANSGISTQKRLTTRSLFFCSSTK
eukprot:13293678-Heterocapsa_arctica.AAC.1